MFRGSLYLLALSFCWLAFAILHACSNEVVVKPAGPAVHDQLNSRGYLITPQDTMPRDTNGLRQDSL